MTAPDRASGQPLYSLVAWPPEALDTWLRRTQERLGVRGFGAPHLNLRAPFQTDLSTGELVAAFREALRGTAPFEVPVRGWKRLPHMLFLECVRTPHLSDLHARALSVGPSTRAPHDGEGYTPHLTLGLGILPRVEDLIWAEVQKLTPPATSFGVEVLSLTREERGEVQEVHTFPLGEGAELLARLTGEAGRAEVRGAEG
ncbi:2'-5' RNA ligase family protein [Deinococcus sp. SDU3-2]|uniref:2'-5' RNA ligase family protein n=1 Tax=Deinococcus terrestris TaxID=2651870 RepID=A0A7X1TR92_9DEIO|nr:2'-5' RNA ligase family protein [Deinococcus terrestris]MPY66159.1 2'-5' RNA ligase family protein [Deinococcus terrestris]